MNPSEWHEDCHQPSRTELTGIQRLDRFPKQPAVALCRQLDEILAEAFRGSAHGPLSMIPWIMVGSESSGRQYSSQKLVSS